MADAVPVEENDSSPPNEASASKKLTTKQKAIAAAATGTGLAATGTALALTGTADAIGTGIAASSAATGAAISSSAAATGSAIVSGLMAPIAGLSIGVPVVAPVVIGIAILVYILVKKHKNNKELYEVMSQAIELIMRIEKCKILMQDILIDTGYITNDLTLNKLLEELMNEIIRICPSSVIKEFEHVLNSGGHDEKIKSEIKSREKEWTFGLKRLRRFTANNFFTKYRYSFIINKLTMINAFFTTSLAEFSLTKMVLDQLTKPVKINKELASIDAFINSLKQGHLLNKQKDIRLYEKNPATYGEQEPLLDALTPYIKNGNNKHYSEIKNVIKSNTEVKNSGGSRKKFTKKRRSIRNYKK